MVGPGAIVILVIILVYALSSEELAYREVGWVGAMNALIWVLSHIYLFCDASAFSHSPGNREQATVLLSLGGLNAVLFLLSNLASIQSTTKNRLRLILTFPHVGVIVA
jgi:hypothetical protein